MSVCLLARQGKKKKRGDLTTKDPSLFSPPSSHTHTHRRLEGRLVWHSVRAQRGTHTHRHTESQTHTHPDDRDAWRRGESVLEGAAETCWGSWCARKSALVRPMPFFYPSVLLPARLRLVFLGVSVSSFRPLPPARRLFPFINLLPSVPVLHCVFSVRLMDAVSWLWYWEPDHHSVLLFSPFLSINVTQV